MIVEAWFFLAMYGSTAVVVGPFQQPADCQRVRSEADKYLFLTSCWRGPVVVSK